MAAQVGELKRAASAEARSREPRPIKPIISSASREVAYRPRAMRPVQAGDFAHAVIIRALQMPMHDPASPAGSSAPVVANCVQPVVTSATGAAPRFSPI